MSWIPGWESITGANSWSNFYFWAGIAALLALGVFEVFSHRYTERKDELVTQQQDETQRRHDEEMARLHLETAKISERAAKAELEVARLSTPRFKLLTPDAAASIVQKIEPFSGVKFDIGHAPIGREQWDFLWVLEPILQKAGWVFIDWKGPKAFEKLNWTMQPHVYGVANASNVSIELDPEYRERLTPAAKAIATALNDVGIDAVVEGGIVGSSSGNIDAIHVLVGAK
jgi:hypothetical protein